MAVGCNSCIGGVEVSRRNERTTISISPESMEFIKSARWENASVAVETIVNRYRQMATYPEVKVSNAQLDWLAQAVQAYKMPVTGRLSARSAIWHSMEGESCWPKFVNGLADIIEKSTPAEAMSIVYRAEDRKVK